jgi:hypothetical protein
MENACCQELMYCGHGTDCAAYNTCLNTCQTGDTTCLSFCIFAHMQGYADNNTLTTCYVQNCKTKPACEYPICNSTVLFPDPTCATCLGSNAGCCAAYTACTADPTCKTCLGTPTGMGCAGNTPYQQVQSCQIGTCGQVCAFSACGTALGYSIPACNACVSQMGSAGCCPEFIACTETNGVMDKNKTCYQCLMGMIPAASFVCTGDASFNAYNTCFTANCAMACGM